MMNKKSFPIPPKQPDIPLTQEKLDSLKRDLIRLTEARDAAAQRVKEAREMGDLSENGAYHYGKFELGSISRQLRHVQFLLKHGKVTHAVSSTIAQFGSQVTLTNPHRKVTYTLVSQYESDPAKGKISIESPIGQAIVGKKIGDPITIHAPAGELHYTLTTLS